MEYNNVPSIKSLSMILPMSYHPSLEKFWKSIVDAENKGMTLVRIPIASPLPFIYEDTEIIPNALGFKKLTFKRYLLKRGPIIWPVWITDDGTNRWIALWIL